MTKKFKHLNLSPHWQQYFSKYPDGYTIIENLIDWVSQVDNMVNNQNELNETVETYGDRLDEFIEQYDAHLQETVEQTLREWQDTGFLDVVIDSALETKYHEMDDRLTAQLSRITLDVKDFGAKGDGSTDDTLAIQSAFDVLEKGQKLLFPEGTYNTKKVHLRKSNVTLEFKGKLNYIGTASNSALIIEGTYLTLETPKITRPYVQEGVAKHELVGIGLDILNCKNVIINNPHISGFGVGIAIHDNNGRGSAYIQTYNPYLINNLEAYKCIHEHQTSWTTETKMFGGRIELSTQNFTDVSDSSYFNLLDDSHRFFGVSAEGTPERKIKGTFKESTFIGCRFEFPNGDVDIEINGDGNSFIHNRDFDSNIQNNGTNNIILSRFKSYFGHPIQQSVKHFTPVAGNNILRMNSDYAYYFIDCSKHSAYLQNNFTDNIANGSVFTIKKVDSSSNPVSLEIIDVDGTHVNPQLLTQNETITFMYLNGKWIVLSNDSYAFNIGARHITYGVGEKKKFYTTDSNYLKYDSEVCVEEGTTGTFTGVTGTGNVGDVFLTFTSGDFSRMNSQSWITINDKPHFVLNWDSGNKRATLLQPLTETVTNGIIQRKNPKFVKYGRYLHMEGDIPTSGQWRKGDIVYNSNPGAGGKLGWVCVAGGVPGQWKAFGQIDS